MFETLLIGDMARRVGLRENQLRRLTNRQAIPFQRVAGMRIFRLDDLPVIVEAARKAGYLPSSDAPAAPA
jgi:DNA-binding transcriptional MerR regulator